MSSLNFVATKMPSVGVEVEVTLCEESIQSVARKLAMALVMSNEGVSQFLSAQEAEESFAYALRVVLCQNSGAKPSFEAVPTFLSDIMMTLNMTYHGVRISCKKVEPPKRPHSYAKFLDVLTSLGIPTGKVLKVDPFSSSNVLEIFLIDVGGAITLGAADDKVTAEQLIVRAMLTVPEVEAEKIRRIVGHIEYQYVSRDELLRQWACSLPVGKR